MADRTKNRSDLYQYILLESAYSPEMLAEVAEEQSISATLGEHQKEELMDLREQLRVEFWRLVDEELTERQAKVLHLYCERYTQIEIAKQLNVNQSSITKSIHGNVDYKRPNNKKSYGGSLRRIKRLVEKDEKIQDILEKIQKIQQDDID